MYIYVKCDKNIKCESRVMNIFTKWKRTDGRTHIVIIVRTQGSCNFNQRMNQDTLRSNFMDL